MNETKNYSITKSGAVILEGGANRGVFTAGALDFLMEQEYYIPHVIGVSAGACNALDYVSRQIGRTRDCMIVTDEKNRYVNKNIKTIVEKKALLDMDMVFERYPYEVFPFDFDTYFASPQTCELVVTNCETGRAEYLDDRENKERLLAIGRASSSMPIACPMVEIDGNEYVDGGVADYPFLKDGTPKKCHYSDTEFRLPQKRGDERLGAVCGGIPQIPESRACACKPRETL